MSSQLISLAGWTILPNLVTGWLQSIWYGFTVRAGSAKPQPGSPKYKLHRRRIHIIVVSAYLLYTIYEADWEIRRAGDFYRDLSIPTSSTEREIKSRFRRLAAIHHPDKVSSQSATSEDYFVHLKLAQDTLLNPVKRFAYERFGPDVVEWQRCSSIRDYLEHGAQQLLPYYFGAAIFMYILGFVGYLTWGKYWRWLSLAVMCVFELHTISRPHFPYFAATIINPLLAKFTNHPPFLPFQLIDLGRKLSVTLYIALSHIGPLLDPPAPQNKEPEIALSEQLDRLDGVATAVNADADRLYKMETVPFHDEAAARDLSRKIKMWLVENTIRSDPEIRDAMGKVLQSRRKDAPAGARGTK